MRKHELIQEQFKTPVFNLEPGTRNNNSIYNFSISPELTHNSMVPY
jgi:hypothetical protein